MTKQAQNSLNLYRGQNPATIKQALRMQKSSIVEELKAHFIYPISIHYIQCLRTANFADDLLPTLMEDLIGGYMMLVHDVHQLNRTWKSYDW